MHAQARWPEHVILRSSIIYGPGGLAPVPRPLFIQFIARQLAARAPTSFFSDEWRNSIYVQDIVSIVLKLLQRGAAQLPQRCRHPARPCLLGPLFTSANPAVVAHAAS
jgi:nucleoside-diphosphate-sugar epimerase